MPWNLVAVDLMPQRYPHRPRPSLFRRELTPLQAQPVEDSKSCWQGFVRPLQPSGALCAGGSQPVTSDL